MSPKRAWPPNCGELHCCPTRIACIGCRPEHVWCEIPCEPMCDQRDVSVVQTSRRQCRDCCDAWIFPKNFPAAAQPDASHPHDETISDTEEIASSGDPKDPARCFGEVDPLAPTCPFICGYQVFLPDWRCSTCSSYGWIPESLWNSAVLWTSACGVHGCHWVWRPGDSELHVDWTGHSCAFPPCLLDS